MDEVSTYFRNATRDMQIFYGELDRDDAIRDFNTAMEEIQEELRYLTEGTDEFFGDKAERAKKVIAGGQTLQKSLEPEDIAGTVLYLLGDASKFVTGQTLMVDGGTVFL